MMNSYIILNRKTNFIIKIFMCIVVFLIILVIWGINTLSYRSFFHIHSQLLNLDSFYYLEVLIPVEEVNFITNKNKIVINSREYNYQVYKIDPNIIFHQQKNCVKLYLEVENLDDAYKINGYQLDVKIEKESKKIIDYLRIRRRN